MKILVDGSNVLFWRGMQAQTGAVDLVLEALIARRFEPQLYFDHSIARVADAAVLEGWAQHVAVLVAPKGTVADGMLLRDCAQGRFQIVSNDRLRDWRSAHPGLRAQWLVTGRIGRRGRVEFSKKLRRAPL